MNTEKRNDLIKFLDYQNISCSEDDELVIENQEWKNRYKISLSNTIYYVKDFYLSKFWLHLHNLDYALIINELCDDKENNVTFIPDVGLDRIDTHFDDEKLSQAMGVNFINVDNRLTKLINTSSVTIREIAKFINVQMDIVAKDTNIVKDFDGVLTFNSELGEDFKVELCFDKIKPVSEENNGLIIDRTKMTDEDMALYLGENKDKIQSRLDHINSLVKAFIDSATVNCFPDVKQYAMVALNGTILRAFLEQKVMFITFGGLDDWSLSAEETPNNKVCNLIIDEKVNDIIKQLDELPKEEGVTIHSIDIDTFTVFGRNDDNKILTAPVKDITSKILFPLSKGFERLLSIRLSQLSNPHFFKI